MNLSSTAIFILAVSILSGCSVESPFPENKNEAGVDHDGGKMIQSCEPRVVELFNSIIESAAAIQSESADSSVREGLKILNMCTQLRGSPATCLSESSKSHFRSVSMNELASVCDKATLTNIRVAALPKPIDDKRFSASKVVPTPPHHATPSPASFPNSNLDSVEEMDPFIVETCLAEGYQPTKLDCLTKNKHVRMADKTIGEACAKESYLPLRMACLIKHKDVIVHHPLIKETCEAENYHPLKMNCYMKFKNVKRFEPSIAKVCMEESYLPLRISCLIDKAAQ